MASGTPPQSTVPPAGASADNPAAASVTDVGTLDPALTGTGTGGESAADLNPQPLPPGGEPARNVFAAKASEAAAVVKAEALSLRDQATGKARDAAQQGKDRATGALDDVARMIGEAADTIDDKVGSQYGDYTRKAAEAVAGFASTLKQRDIDDLVNDAAAFVKKSPAVAIGAAAAIGFVLARLIKAGTGPETEA